MDYEKQGQLLQTTNSDYWREVLKTDYVHFPLKDHVRVVERSTATLELQTARHQITDRRYQ